MTKEEDSIALLRRFKRLTGSLETLVSSIAQDWEADATAPAEASVVGLLEEDGPTRPIHGKMRKAQLLFSELHSTTRKTHGAIEAMRNKVATAKQTMDHNHLQLENLLYERDHLSRETQLCKDFTMTELSKMEEAEEQAFLEDVDVLQTAEEHAKNLDILKDQKGQRISAQEELEAAQMRVKAATAAVKESRDYLDRLPEHLKDVERALVPLKKNMPWRPGSRRGRHEQAAELPGPLFTLYCQLEGYCDSVMTETASAGNSEIVSLSAVPREGGELEEHSAVLVSVSVVPAKVHVSGSAKAAAEGPKDASDSAEVPGAADNMIEKDKSAAGDKSGIEPDGKRQKRHYEQDGGSGGGGKEKRSISRKEAGRLTLEALRPSPMDVVLTLDNANLNSNALTMGAASKGKEGNSDAHAFSVRFSYLPTLGIVTVSPPPSGASAGILANLFPNDTGKDTPNAANHHGAAARASPLGVFEYPADVPCRPYRWAQWLAGLHFSPPALGAAGTAVRTIRPVMPIEPSTRAVLAALRSRARTHVALSNQLKRLSAGKGPSPLPGMADHTPDVTEDIEMRSWRELSGSDVQQAATAFQELDAPQVAVRESDGAGSSGHGNHDRDPWERYGARYFKGMLTTKKGSKKHRTVHIQVEVPGEYPVRPSLINLKEDKPGAETTGEASLGEELCAVTNEVNAHYDALLTDDVTRWDHLLSHQLILVMECLSSKGGDLGKLRRGRMRRTPVLFDRLERKFVHR